MVGVCHIMCIDFFVTYATVISAVSEFLTFILGLVAFVVTVIGYKQSVKNKKSEVLAEYNARYTDNCHIRQVVKYYLERNADDKPTLYDKEMFLRFFEELELMIERGYLDLEDVRNLFSYYFIVIWSADNDSFFWNEEMVSPYNNVDEVKNSKDWALAARFYEKIRNDNSIYNVK